MRLMGHNLLTCIFANAMQQSSSTATATGTQILFFSGDFLKLFFLDPPIIFGRLNMSDNVNNMATRNVHGGLNSMFHHENMPI